MKTYEVEFTSTTCRSYYVDAVNKAEAEEKAWKEIECGAGVSNAWIGEAKVTSIRLEGKSNG